MPYEKKAGDAVAWNPRKENHPLSIKCTAHRDLREGEEFEVAVWRNRDKSSEKAPDFSGHVQDKYVPQTGHMSRAEYNRTQGPKQAGTVAADAFEDDIPF